MLVNKLFGGKFGFNFLYKIILFYVNGVMVK